MRPDTAAMKGTGVQMAQAVAAKIRRYVFLILPALIPLRWMLISAEGFSRVEPFHQPGKFIVHHTEYVPRNRIRSVIAQDQNIYIYYDDVGLVNVYAADGTFLYGLQVSTINNGRGSMAFGDGILYVESKGHTLYVFREESLLESITYSYTETEEKTPEALRYRELERVFEKEQSAATNGKTYFLSQFRTAVYEKDLSTGACSVVSFLPQRNVIAEAIPVILVVWYVGCVFRRQYVRMKSRREHLS